jgi:hypothetical protein
MRERRAARRGLRPAPVLAAEPVSTETTSPVEPAAPGAVVAAVRADLAALGDLAGWRAIGEAAVAMARILDHPGAVTTQPAAARQLMSLLDTLHRSAAPKRGRLAVVQAMTNG